MGGSCPGCGSGRDVHGRRKRSGGTPGKRSWEASALHEGLDLPNPEFGYEEFVAREFGREPHQVTGLSWKWWATALGLVLGLMTLLIPGRKGVAPDMGPGWRRSVLGQPQGSGRMPGPGLLL